MSSVLPPENFLHFEGKNVRKMAKALDLRHHRARVGSRRVAGKVWPRYSGIFVHYEDAPKLRTALFEVSKEVKIKAIRNAIVRAKTMRDHETVKDLEKELEELNV